DDDARRPAGAVWQDHGPAHELVRVARVDAQAKVRLDRGVELGERDLGQQLRGLRNRVAALRLDELGRLAVFLAVSHQSATSMPMLRAVPARMRIAWSMSLALRSGILTSAISRSCFCVTRPTFSRLGSAEPFSAPAARLSNAAASGALVTKVKERSSKTV